jgi:hypothetical protein
MLLMTVVEQLGLAITQKPQRNMKVCKQGCSGALFAAVCRVRYRCGTAVPGTCWILWILHSGTLLERSKRGSGMQAAHPAVCQQCRAASV